MPAAPPSKRIPSRALTSKALSQAIPTLIPSVLSGDERARD
jgi:hypothetical protein